MKNSFALLLSILLVVAILSTAYVFARPDDHDDPEVSSDPFEDWVLIFEGIESDTIVLDAEEKIVPGKYRFVGTGTKQGEYFLTIDLIATDGEEDLFDITWIDECLEMDSLDPAYVPYVPFDFTAELDLSDYDEENQVTHFNINDQTVEYSTLKIYRYAG